MFTAIRRGLPEALALHMLQNVANGLGTAVLLGLHHWLLGIWLEGGVPGVSLHKPSE